MKLYHATSYVFDRFEPDMKIRMGSDRNGPALYAGFNREEVEKWKRGGFGTVLSFDIDDALVFDDSGSIFDRFGYETVAEAVITIAQKDGFLIEDKDDLVRRLKEIETNVPDPLSVLNNSLQRTCLMLEIEMCFQDLGFKHPDFPKPQHFENLRQQFLQELGIAAVLSDGMHFKEAIIFDLNKIGPVTVETTNHPSADKQGWKPGAVVIGAGNIPMNKALKTSSGPTIRVASLSKGPA